MKKVQSQEKRQHRSHFPFPRAVSPLCLPFLGCFFSWRAHFLRSYHSELEIPRDLLLKPQFSDQLRKYHRGASQTSPQT